MYIAGTDDDIQGGICMGGIAHAPRPRLQPAMWFDGLDDFVGQTIADPWSSYSDGTVTAWIFISDPPGAAQNIFTTGDTADNSRFIFFAVNRTMNLFFGQRNNDINDTFVGTTVLPLKTWFHVAFSSDGNLYTAFLNAVSETIMFTTGVNSGDWFAETSPRNVWSIGAFRRVTTTNFLKGVIRDVRIYDHALSLAEVGQVKDGEVGVGGLLGRWIGNGNTDDAWRDQIGTAHSTVYGSPERALIREGDKKVILNNIIQNP